MDIFFSNGCPTAVFLNIFLSHELFRAQWNPAVEMHILSAVFNSFTFKYLMKIEKHVIQVQNTQIYTNHYPFKRNLPSSNSELSLPPLSSFCFLYTDYTSHSCSLFRDGVCSMQIRSVSWQSILLFHLVDYFGHV